MAEYRTLRLTLADEPDCTPDAALNAAGESGWIIKSIQLNDADFFVALLERQTAVSSKLQPPRPAPTPPPLKRSLRR